MKSPAAPPDSRAPFSRAADSLAGIQEVLRTFERGTSLRVALGRDRQTDEVMLVAQLYPLTPPTNSKG